MTRVAMLLALVSAAAPAFAEGARGRFARPIDFVLAGQEEILVAVDLDDAAYAGTAQGFSDLRIADDRGIETPFLLRKVVREETETVERPVPSRIKTFSHSDGRSVEVIVELEKDGAKADGIRIATPQRDFEYSVRVFGSGDLQNWSPLVDGARIYDYSRFMDVRDDSVPLPANDYRYFKIVCDDAVQDQAADTRVVTRTLDEGKEIVRNERIEEERRALRIDGIELWRNSVETVSGVEEMIETPISGIRVRQDAERKTSVIDIPTADRPFRAFILQTNSVNFSRRLEIEAKTGTEAGSRMVLGERLIRSLKYKDILSEQRTVEFEELRAKSFRLTIRNDDNPPLEIAGVVGVGPRYQALFMASPGKRYELRYGDSTAKTPRYDVAIIEELLQRRFEPTQAALGPERRNGKGGGFSAARVLNSVWFLGAVIAVVAAVLAWSLIRAAKKMRE